MPILTYPINDPWPALPPGLPIPLVSGVDAQSGIEVYAEEGLATGVWGGEPWVSCHGPYPTDEFMVVVQGAITIRQSGDRADTITAGEVFFLPKGLEFQWEQAAASRKVYVIFEPGEPKPMAGVSVRLDPAMPLEPLAPPAAEAVEGAVPAQAGVTTYSDGTGRFSVGVWTTTDHMTRMAVLPAHEVIHLVAGRVTLTEEGMAPVSFAAGDTFFIQAGTCASIRYEGGVRVVFCAVQPA